jgi:hypothetical protein
MFPAYVAENGHDDIPGHNTVVQVFIQIRAPDIGQRGFAAERMPPVGMIREEEPAQPFGGEEEGPFVLLVYSGGLNPFFFRDLFGREIGVEQAIGEHFHERIRIVGQAFRAQSEGVIAGKRVELSAQ